VLERYAAHPNVVGLGIDVEWFLHEEHKDGCPITTGGIGQSIVTTSTR
jgi:hypothetical protein